MKQSRLTAFLLSCFACGLASSGITSPLRAESLEAALLAEVSGQAQATLRSLSGVGIPGSQACQAETDSRRSVCEAAEGPLSETDTRDALTSTRIALLDQQLQLATATPQELKYALLSEAEILQRLGSKLQDQDAQAGAEAMAQADALRAFSEDPALRDKLDGVLQKLTPGKDHLEWDPSWRKFSKTEMAAIPLLGLGSAAAEMKFGNELKANWTRTNKLDETFRRIFHIEDPSLSKKLYRTGDLLVTGNVLAALLDPGVMRARDRRNGPAALQVMLINLESFALTALSYSVTKGLFARARPLVRECEDQGCIDRPQNNQSFFSGHAAFAFTAAGLLCTHRSYMEIYGNKAVDRAACWTAMAAAATVAYSRMAADKHYGSDIAVGTAIGLFSGMALPRLLHYGWGGKKEAPGDSRARSAGPQAPIQAIVAPYAMRKGGGLLCEVYF